MEGGNEASAASGITQFAEGEPKRQNYDNKWFCQWMEGGNGVREANVVTLCSKCTYQIFGCGIVFQQVIGQGGAWGRRTPRRKRSPSFNSSLLIPNS